MTTDLLTLKDLRPDKLYRVVDPGAAHREYVGAVVMGAGRHAPTYGVTVWMDPPSGADDGLLAVEWIGIYWGNRNDRGIDAEARFEPLPLENFVAFMMTRRMDGLPL